MRLRLDDDACSDAAKRVEACGIPVRQPEASVRFSAADALGDGCAVDAVAREGESEPGDPHGIVRSIHEHIARPFCARRRMVGRIGVVRIGDERDDLEFSLGGFGLVLCDGAGEESQQRPAAVIRGDFELGEGNLDERRLRARGIPWQGARSGGKVVRHFPEVREGDARPRADFLPVESWVQPLNRPPADMTALSECLLDGFVAEMGEPGLFGGVGRNGDERGKIGGRNLVLPEKTAPNGEETVVGLFGCGRQRQFAVGAVAFEGGLGLATPLPINRVAGVAKPVQPNLDGERLRFGERQ